MRRSLPTAALLREQYRMQQEARLLVETAARLKKIEREWLWVTKAVLARARRGFGYADIPRDLDSETHRRLQDLGYKVTLRPGSQDIFTRVNWESYTETPNDDGGLPATVQLHNIWEAGHARHHNVFK